MRYRSRLARLERLRRPVERGPAVVVVFPDEWPAADQAAFNGGDPAIRDALVERHTGQQLGRHTRILVIRRREDGPRQISDHSGRLVQWDPPKQVDQILTIAADERRGDPRAPVASVDQGACAPGRPSGAIAMAGSTLDLQPGARFLVFVRALARTGWRAAEGDGS